MIPLSNLGQEFCTCNAFTKELYKGNSGFVSLLWTKPPLRKLLKMYNHKIWNQKTYNFQNTQIALFTKARRAILIILYLLLCYFNNTVLAIVLFSSFVDFTIPRVIAILPFYFSSLDLLSQSASGQTTPMPLLVVSKNSFSFFSSAMGKVQ